MATDLTRHDPLVEPSDAPAAASRAAARVVGVRAALLAVVLTVVFVGLTVAFPGGEWAGIESYADGFQTIQVAQLVPVLLLAPVVVVLMSCIQTVTAPARRLFGHLALAFSVAYAVVVTTNYVLQLVVVRHHVVGGEFDGLALLAMPNPSSIFVGLEITGYGFFALMALAASEAFRGAGRARWIRWLLAVTGVTGLIGAAGGLAGQQIVMLAGFGASLLAFLAVACLLALHFHRWTELPTAAADGSAPGGQQR